MANPESESGVIADTVGFIGMLGFILIFFITEMITAPFLDFTDTDK